MDPRDPFAVGQDAEVLVSLEQDSDTMHVLSPEEEIPYVTAALQESIDLHDVALIMLNQGLRPDEVMSLRQCHVDLTHQHFTIWESAAEGKSKNAHRKLHMTTETYKVFARRLSKPGTWVFPSTKNDGPRRTVQKSHERVTRANKDSEGCGVPCRLYDMRHTFATRFALAGGSLPVLAKILGHADLSLLMRYVHPSQHDMDRAMAWYSSTRVSTPEMEAMLVESVDGSGPTFGPRFGPTSAPNLAQDGLFQPNLEIETKRRP